MAIILRRKATSNSDNAKFVARGYLSGLICFAIKLVYNINYVFDPRSLYPLECLTAKRLKRNTFAFGFWMWLEARIVSEADSIVCTSRGMLRYFQIRYKYKCCKSMPCFNSGRVSSYGSGCSKSKLFRILGLLPSKRLLIYYGSLNSGWNNIKVYYDVITSFDHRYYQVLFITQDEELIKSSPLASLANVSISSHSSLPPDVTIAECFRHADFGIIFMAYSRDWYTRLSVKFAEYTSHGLPVVTNRWVGEASSLIRRYNLACCRIIDFTKPFEVFVAPSHEQREDLKHWAQEYFSCKNINNIS